jgi:hypothetical protein
VSLCRFFSFLGVGPFVGLDKYFNNRDKRLMSNKYMHRVYRVPGFLSSRPNWVPPPHRTAREYFSSPPFGSKGEDTLARGGGGNPKKGQAFWYFRNTIILLSDTSKCDWNLLFRQTPCILSCIFFKQSMGATNGVGIGLSHRPARLHRPTELIPWNRFLGSLKV